MNCYWSLVFGILCQRNLIIGDSSPTIICLKDLCFVRKWNWYNLAGNTDIWCFFFLFSILHSCCNGIAIKKKTTIEPFSHFLAQKYFKQKVPFTFINFTCTFEVETILIFFFVLLTVQYVPLLEPCNIWLFHKS